MGQAREERFIQELVSQWPIEAFYEGVLDRFARCWESAPELPLYLALDSLADHLLLQLTAKETGRFAAIFDVVERWHVDGDPFVSQAATIGLLESLQNLTGGNSRIGTVKPWLGPESRRSWGELDRFWQGKQSAV